MYKNTAAGVAKIRFTELQAKNPIVEDKFSSPFVLGSSIIRITGHRLQYFGFEALVPGLFDGVVARTKIIDETVLKAVKDGATQYVILGAGYDTRGHRLDLPANVKVFEVDQPDIQAFKVKKVSKLELPNKEHITYVPVDFNAQSLETELRKAEGFDPNAKTVVTLEGVSYYIPRESCQNTISTISTIVGTGSTFFLSYADKNCEVNPSAVCSPENSKGPGSLKRLMRAVKMVGEPWVNFFEQAELPAFFKSNGFTLSSDSSLLELNQKYFAPKGREIPAKRLMYWERFAVAVK